MIFLTSRSLQRHKKVLKSMTPFASLREITLPFSLSRDQNKEEHTSVVHVAVERIIMFDDQAHALVYQWRSVQDLQNLATTGRFGKQPGILHPFSNLKVNELKAELTARGIHINSSMHKNDLQAILDRTLRGVTRVPALLLPNPTQSLTSLNLERYEILASEPLHDIKGHILNLITELPYILPTGEEWITSDLHGSCCSYITVAGFIWSCAETYSVHQKN